MEDSRLTKKIFIADKVWCKDLENIFDEIDQRNVLDSLWLCDIEAAETTLREKHAIKWKELLQNSIKLQMYSTFKSEHYEEPFLTRFLTRSVRSLFCQFRYGILPLRVETGRYKNEPRDERICTLCGNGIEDGLHLLFVCQYYNDISYGISL